MSDRRRIALAYALQRPGKAEALLKLGVRRAASRFVGRARALRIPETIYVRITDKSDLVPTCCGRWATTWSKQRRRHGREGTLLSTSQWLCFLESAAPLRPYVFFDGGEPLMRDDMMHIVHRVCRWGCLCGMRTNGTRLGAQAEAVVDSGLDFLLVNLDGPEGVNCTITGDPASYRATTDGIRAVLKARAATRSLFPVVQMTTCVGTANQASLLEMAHIAEELGVDIFALNFPVFTTLPLLQQTRDAWIRHLGVTPDHWTAFTQDPTEIDCDLVERQVTAIRTGKWTFSYRQFPAVRGFDVRTHLRRPEIPHKVARGCWLASRLAVVLPNGDVATCWDHPDYIVGNVTTERQEDIWRGRRYRTFRSVVGRQAFPSCARCNGLYY